MQGIIVVDTSCLVLLDKIEHTHILSLLFGRVTITSIVAKEFGKELPSFIEINNPTDSKYQQIIEGFLDPGEASSIALALENDYSLLVIDEAKGRREARFLNITVTGTIGLLIVAKEKGLIDSIAKVFDLIALTDFRISNSLIQEAKKKCNEG